MSNTNSPILFAARCWARNVEAIRRQTNNVAAGYVRTHSATEIRDTIRKVAMEITWEPQVQDLVEFLLRQVAVAAVDAVKNSIPEITGNSASAQEARQAIVNAACISGQYIKPAAVASLKSNMQVLKERVGETIAEICCEAMVVSALTQTSKYLPAPEK